jgi:hypothetical protein
VGSVGGQVLSAVDDRPLAGALVRVVSGDFNATATTDGSGFFSVSDVPASGTVMIHVEANGMLTADTTATFTPEAGDFPMSNATLTVAKEDPGDPTNMWTRITFSEPVGFGSPGTSLSGNNCVLRHLQPRPQRGHGRRPGRVGEHQLPLHPVAG